MPLIRRCAVLLLLAGCEWPVMSIAERVLDAGEDAREPDADADGDEYLIPCTSAAECPNPREPDDALCDLARGACVECFSDRDCPSGETCDADGDCDD